MSVFGFRDLAVLVLASALPAAQAGGGGASPTCNIGDLSPCSIGQWEGPYHLAMTCTGAAPSGGFDCDSCDRNDEIGHASLIPAGPHAGKVLIWTKCDLQTNRGSANPYRSYYWDPADPSAQNGPLASPPNDVAQAMRVGADDDGPFCAGPVWVLDGNKHPKLLVVGGHDYETSPLQIGKGTTSVYWFNPLESSVLPEGPSTPPGWFDGPVELPDPVWYPSLGRFLSSPTSFSVMVVGGSSHQGAGCGSAPPITWQYRKHWTLDDFQLGTWASPSDNYDWHQYPRTLMLYDDGEGNVYCVGHTVICEYPVVAGFGTPDINNPFGGFPFHKIINGTTLVDLDSPNPGSPEDVVVTQNDAYEVGGWHYANAALLHTLKPAYRSPQSSFPNPLTTDPKTLWDLDRIIVNGGVPENADPRLPDPLVVPALGTWEYSNSAWTEKASDPTPRVFGQLVILPDGSLLAVGGQSDGTVEGGDQQKTKYRFGAHRFDPGAPGSSGAWTAMKGRETLGTAPPDSGFASFYGDDEYSMPRGYHSVGILLRDGSVALMGGEQTRYHLPIPQEGEGYDPSFLTSEIPEDSVEVYRPPFTFENGRPRITQVNPLPVMQYGEEYCLQVNDPNKVDYACLIGVGSVTHHFDYGQRYIELMIKRGPCGSGNLRILPPTRAAMAPEGYYLLFLAQKRQRSSGQTIVVPSQGSFVKLTF